MHRLAGDNQDSSDEMTELLRSHDNDTLIGVHEVGQFEINHTDHLLAAANRCVF